MFCRQTNNLVTHPPK